LNLGVRFDSNESNTTYGGSLLVNGPVSVAPIVVGIWDGDGDVFFTLYDLQDGAVGESVSSLVIDAGAGGVPATPYVKVFSHSGLACDVVQTGGDPVTNALKYTLTVSVAP